MNMPYVYASARAHQQHNTPHQNKKVLVTRNTKTHPYEMCERLDSSDDPNAATKHTTPVRSLYVG